jgi:hypothetical protein
MNQAVKMKPKSSRMLANSGALAMGVGGANGVAEDHALS